MRWYKEHVAINLFKITTYTEKDYDIFSVLTFDSLGQSASELVMMLFEEGQCLL